MSLVDSFGTALKTNTLGLRGEMLEGGNRSAWMETLMAENAQALCLPIARGRRQRIARGWAGEDRTAGPGRVQSL